MTFLDVCLSYTTHILYIYIHMYIIYIFLPTPILLKHVQMSVRFNSPLDRLCWVYWPLQLAKLGQDTKTEDAHRADCRVRHSHRQMCYSDPMCPRENYVGITITGSTFTLITLSCFTLSFYLAKSSGQKQIAFASTFKALSKRRARSG